jgi:hypothetical protein
MFTFVNGKVLGVFRRQLGSALAKKPDEHWRNEDIIEQAG